METAGPAEDQRWTGGLKTTFLFIVSGECLFFWDLSRSAFFAQLWQSLGLYQPFATAQSPKELERGDHCGVD